MNTIFNKCNKVVNCNIHSFGEIFNEFNSINNDYNNTNCSNASVISNTDINKNNNIKGIVDIIDSNIEQNGNNAIYLENLFGPNVIENCLLENSPNVINVTIIGPK